MREVAEECFDAGRRAGYTTVGEFHYVHHRQDGTPYEEPNELALAVIAAARSAGVRLVLLLAAYARAGAGRRAERRASGASATAASRPISTASSGSAAEVAGDPLVTVGYAPHSVRAVPRRVARA